MTGVLKEITENEIFAGKIKKANGEALRVVLF